MTWDHLHEEDILYDFRGNDPSELAPGRFYRGTVDGFAEFGVFVTLGDGVTGLLHRSKLDQRLEGLDWDAGDEVIVQVEGIRDNGNIDLAWSIRQTDREFRGHDVDPAGTDDEPDPAKSEASEPDDDPEATADDTPEPTETRGGATTPAPADTPSPEPADTKTTEAIARESVEDLDESVSERVRLEGQITDVRQTSGPTIFSLTDESGTVECAAFEAAGVRAYPTIETDDVVRVVGVVDRHRGEIQLETESIERLEDDDRDAVIERVEAVTRERAQPDDASLLLVDPVVADLNDDLVAAATRLREAVLAGQRIIIRHPASADGVIAGAALERALASFAEREGPGKATDRIVVRRPMDDPWYELGDALYDQGGGEGDDDPLIALVGAGGSEADEPALRFLDIYDIPAVVVDASVRGAVSDALVDAAAISQSAATVTVVATHTAGIVDETIRDEISPLPAVSYSENPPDRYATLADEQGLDSATVRERHEAISLLAFYQRYSDKRELIGDLLFEDDAAELASHVSAQYRDRVATAVETAQTNCDRISMVDRTITILDAEAHSHRFDFPPRPVLTTELFHAERQAGEGDVVVVLGTDECYLAGAIESDLPTLAEQVASRIPTSSIEATRDRLTFLSGTRGAVREALVESLSSAAPA